MLISSRAPPPIDIPIRPLVDDHGMVLPRTPPSPTPPTTLLFGNRVETPASWPPSDDMNIETHTPPERLKPLEVTHGHPLM
jgi:hypothetical protein